MGLARTKQDNEPENTLEANEFWEAHELASFVIHPGVGRILCVGGTNAEDVQGFLKDAQYEVGHLGQEFNLDQLPRAAATFLPDLIYLELSEPVGTSIEALESLAVDSRTNHLPLIALVPPSADASIIEEAYTRTGCDFFRIGHTPVELLARTHMLVRMSRSQHQLVPNSALSGQLPQIDAANDPLSGRFDMRDPVTSLYSAGYFFHRLPGEIARSRRHQRPLSIMVLNCPEAANDELVSVTVARTLCEHLRTSDVSARIEPDQYVALLPEAPSDVLENLKQRISESLTNADIQSSIGHAGLDDGDNAAHTPQSLLELARKSAGF